MCWVEWDGGCRGGATLIWVSGTRMCEVSGVVFLGWCKGPSAPASPVRVWKHATDMSEDLRRKCTCRAGADQGDLVPEEQQRARRDALSLQRPRVTRRNHQVTSGSFFCFNRVRDKLVMIQALNPLLFASKSFLSCKRVASAHPQPGADFKERDQNTHPWPIVDLRSVPNQRRGCQNEDRECGH